MPLSVHLIADMQLKGNRHFRSIDAKIVQIGCISKNSPVFHFLSHMGCTTTMPMMLYHRLNYLATLLLCHSKTSLPTFFTFFTLL